MVLSLHLLDFKSDSMLHPKFVLLVGTAVLAICIALPVKVQPPTSSSTTSPDTVKPSAVYILLININLINVISNNQNNCAHRMKWSTVII